MLFLSLIVLCITALNLARFLSQENTSSPILLLYTDGDPDHNLTLLSVQLSLIALYSHFDLDMFQVVRTAPYQPLQKSELHPQFGFANSAIDASQYGGELWKNDCQL